MDAAVERTRTYLQRVSAAYPHRRGHKFGYCRRIYQAALGVSHTPCDGDLRVAVLFFAHDNNQGKVIGGAGGGCPHAALVIEYQYLLNGNCWPVIPVYEFRTHRNIKNKEGLVCGRSGHLA